MLTEIDRGTVDLSLGNWAGSVATYICDKDYALLGQSTRKCQTTGMWSGTEPSCSFGNVYLLHDGSNLTLSQMTNFRLFQERVCRLQFQI